MRNNALIHMQELVAHVSYLATLDDQLADAAREHDFSLTVLLIPVANQRRADQ